MILGQNREQLRRMYVDAWCKQQAGEPVSPLEAMIAEVVAMHPEYHALLKRGENALDKDFLPEQGESNPFMHMGMHISLAEQISTDRPAGIRDTYQKIKNRVGDAHAAEHHMMECLGLALWEAQQQNRPPDETAYLDCLKKLT